MMRYDSILMTITHFKLPIELLKSISTIVKNIKLKSNSSYVLSIKSFMKDL